MTNTELESTLRQMTRGSVTGILLIGAGTFGMGFLAMLCGLFRVDPDMRHYSHTMWIAYILMVLFFSGVGGLMVISGFFIVPRRGNDFVDRVLHRPETLTRIWLLLIKSQYTPNAQPGQLGVNTSLCAQTNDGKQFQFTVKGAIAQNLLNEIAQRAPHAQIGPPNG